MPALPPSGPRVHRTAPGNREARSAYVGDTRRRLRGGSTPTDSHEPWPATPIRTRAHRRPPPRSSGRGESPRQRLGPPGHAASGALHDTTTGRCRRLGSAGRLGRHLLDEPRTDEGTGMVNDAGAPGDEGAHEIVRRDPAPQPFADELLKGRALGGGEGEPGLGTTEADEGLVAGGTRGGWCRGRGIAPPPGIGARSARSTSG